MEILFVLLGFAVLAWIANRAEQARTQGADVSLYAIVTYSTVVLIHFALFVAGIAAQAFGVLLRDPTFFPSLPEWFQAIGEGPIELGSINWTLAGAGVWIPALIGLLVLLPPIRGLLGRLINIDPASHVHAVALSLSTLALPNLLVTLGIGLENITASLVDSLDPLALITSTWLQNLGFFIVGLAGVGLFSRRGWRASLTRLKLHALSGRELLIGVASGVGLLFVLAGVLAGAEALGWRDPTVDALSEELYGPFFDSIVGILTVGIAAAWGEETIFRGALQPKFGRILTAILFAIIHGNYGLSVVTLGIFIVGYMLGLIRDRYSTTTAMLTHATFNSVQALIAYWAIQYGLGI